MSHRVEQVSGLIRKELGAIINRELELPSGALLTITKVVVGPDFKFARVYIKILPDNFAPKILSFLTKERLVLQQQLVSRLTMKFSPRISFVLERESGAPERVEALLAQLQKERHDQ